jgi:hypothetical protein
MATGMPTPSRTRGLAWRVGGRTQRGSTWRPCDTRQAEPPGLTWRTMWQGQDGIFRPDWLLLAVDLVPYGGQRSSAKLDLLAGVVAVETASTAALRPTPTSKCPPRAAKHRRSHWHRAPPRSLHMNALHRETPCLAGRSAAGHPLPAAQPAPLPLPAPSARQPPWRGFWGALVSPSRPRFVFVTYAASRSFTRGSLHQSSRFSLRYRSVSF